MLRALVSAQAQLLRFRLHTQGLTPLAQKGAHITLCTRSSLRIKNLGYAVRRDSVVIPDNKAGVEEAQGGIGQEVVDIQVIEGEAEQEVAALPHHPPLQTQGDYFLGHPLPIM